MYICMYIYIYIYIYRSRTESSASALPLFCPASTGGMGLGANNNLHKCLLSAC